MNCTAYWRNPLKVLCSAEVTDAANIKEAQQLVLEMLHEDNEIFMLPLLCLIKGGKA